jgi:hypothetical protein
MTVYSVEGNGKYETDYNYMTNFIKKDEKDLEN